MRKFFLPSLIALSCLAFAIRLGVCHELLAADPQVSRPSAMTDMATYKEMSELFLRGEYREEFYYQPFYYAVFLPAVKGIFGTGPWGLMLVQSALSALTVWLVGLSAAIMRGRIAGLAAALLTTFTGILIFYVPYHLIATLQAFWVALILWLSLDFIRNGGYLRATILGLISGMAILTRGNVWFFVPGLLGMIVWCDYRSAQTRHNSSRQAWLQAALAGTLFIAMLILPQIPFAWKNSQIRGQLTGPSTAAGAVLALGNTPEAPPGGRNPGTGPGPMEYPRTYHAWGRAEGQTGVFQQIMRWAYREPAAFIELQFRKLLLYWDWQEIPNNIDWQYQGQRSRILRQIAVVPGSLLISLTLAWLLTFAASICRKRTIAHPGLWLTAYLILAYWLATAAFYILSRFRVPSIPLFAVCAGLFLDMGIRKLRARNWTGLNRYFVLPTILAGAIVFAGFSVYRVSLEAGVMRIVRPYGIRSELGQSRTLYLDHGPMSFGGWIPVPINEGSFISKQFILHERDHEKPYARLTLPLFWEVPGKAIIEINGITVPLAKKEPGLVEHEFAIAVPTDGKIEIRFRDMDCRLQTIFDSQRQYGRSGINNKPAPGELVAYLTLSTKAETE